MVSGVDINLPGLGTDSTQTTLEDTTIGQPDPPKTVQTQRIEPPAAAPSAGPTIQHTAAESTGPLLD